VRIVYRRILAPRNTEPTVREAMTGARGIDWSRYDERAKSLERQLEGLLSAEPLASDDERLARVYLAFAKLTRPLMSAELRKVLTDIERWRESGVYPPELERVSRRLGEISWQRLGEANDTGRPSEQAFLYALLESCARRRFTIDASTDIDPIGWMVAIGIPPRDVAQAVIAEYPQVTWPEENA